MVIAVFVGSLLGAMAIDMAIAFALLVCGVALMLFVDIFDAQIVAQNVINGADSFPLMAVPFFMLAGEVMNTGGLSRRIVDVGCGTGALSAAIADRCCPAAVAGVEPSAGASATPMLVPMLTWWPAIS